MTFVCIELFGIPLYTGFYDANNDMLRDRNMHDQNEAVGFQAYIVIANIRISSILQQSIYNVIAAKSGSDM